MASVEQILDAIDALAGVDGALFNPSSLAEDVACTAAAFPEVEDFEAAIASTVRMLGLIVADKVDTSELTRDYDGWECCHYQHRTAQGARADMRLMFSRAQDGVRVRGFGERRTPADFYRRMAQLERMGLGDVEG